MKKKKLPVGIPDFETIRQDGYVYVDKTEAIYRMISEGKFYFLSRPRRFGKSVLVSTLRSLFQARKELFDDLWIATQSDWAWQESPVILFDFTGIANDTPDVLKLALETWMANVAESYGIVLKTPLLISKFSELILAVARKTGKSAAVLVDEYDKPIIDHLGKGAEHLEIAKANRDLLKQLFGVLKGISVAPSLRFVFLTGITRFSKVSIFSELNNLNDISMNGRYADILGYTQEELEMYFAEDVRQFAESSNCSREEAMRTLTAQYDGYRFSERELRIYNPFSMLKALDAKKIGNYWFETGTPTFLVNLLRESGYNLPEVEGWQASESLFSVFDVERLSPAPLLFQTGYLTIKSIENRMFILDYPNQEVKSAFTETLLHSFSQAVDDETGSRVANLSKYLKQEQFEAFFETMTAVFASIPYDIQSKRDEAYFHTIFYLMMTASGADARSSLLTCRGRIDMAILFPERVYIFEFKCDQSAETALQQIRANGYAEMFREEGKKIVLIGIDFDPEQRNIVEWKVER